MKIAVLGASGWIGSHLVNAAKDRGHQVVALVRDTNKFPGQGVEVRSFDLLAKEADISSVLDGVEVVLSAIGGRAAGNHQIVAETAGLLLDKLPKVGVKRLLWVGGAGSLEVAPGITLMSVPEFPEEYKAEAEAQSGALDVFRNSNSQLNWTFVSPAAEIFPGENKGEYRIGGDQLLVDEAGKSRISVSDYVRAMIDELEAGKYPSQRIAVAY
jgi:uncharacterized protein